MAASTKPRRKYRPRPVAADPLRLAMRRASRIPEQELAEVHAHNQGAFQALRQGVASELQWCLLASAVEVGLAVEHLGVVRGLHGHLKAAEAALQAIYQRAMADGSWKPTALYWQEIDHLDTFLWLHREQLQTLSEGEWRKAHDRAMGVVMSSRGRAIDVQDLPAQEQLQLLGGAHA